MSGMPGMQGVAPTSQRTVLMTSDSVDAQACAQLFAMLGLVAMAACPIALACKPSMCATGRRVVPPHER
jgi:hypothetical protein